MTDGSVSALRPLRIGIDGRMLGWRLSGVPRYVRELCAALDRIVAPATFYVYAPEPIEMPVRADNWIARIAPLNLGGQGKNYLWVKLKLARICDGDRLDIFWATFHMLPILSRRTRTFLTIHDLCHLIEPATMVAKGRWALRMFLTRDLHRANAVLTNSRGTADRLRAILGVEAAAVVRPAVSENFTPQSEEQVRACLDAHRIRSPYLLAVATWAPHKNLQLLVRTFIRMKEEGLLPSISLVIAGGRGWKDERLAATLAGATRDLVMPLGYVPDGDLPALYSGARAFVFPSIYEGFGMPVLEARACGTPVVTTDIPELREAGGPDAVYIAPTEDGICSGILRALTIPKRSIRPADLWTWDDQAKILARVLCGN